MAHANRINLGEDDDRHDRSDGYPKQYDAAKLVKVYIKMRDKKAEITRKAESDVADIDEQMEIVERALLEI